VHVSDVSWTERIKKSATRFFQEGRTPSPAKVLRVDEDNRRVSLGMKTGKRHLGRTGFKQHKVRRKS